MIWSTTKSNFGSHWLIDTNKHENMQKDSINIYLIGPIKIRTLVIYFSSQASDYLGRGPEYILLRPNKMNEKTKKNLKENINLISE